MRRSLFRGRRLSRRYGWAALAIFILLALCGGGLVLSGRNAPPPEFKLADNGLLIPVGYPLWQRASDWLGRRKYIMLTFDDGPYGHGIDEKILAVLAKHHAHAAFFEVCANVTNTTRNVLQKILKAGSIVGNHTYNHRHLPKLDAAALQQQIAGCSAKLASVTGMQPSLFRPPWGQLSPEAIKVIHASGMQIVLWDANSEDSWLKNPRKIVDMSLYEASLGGGILLMHSRPTTAKALDGLLAKLQQQGFRFVLPTINKK